LDLSSYPFKRAPRAKQLEALRRSVDERVFALLMEQRTGKSKVVIDTAGLHFFRFLESGGDYADPRGGITGLVISAAPGRVHRNWAKYELPADLPDAIPRMAVVWEASRVSYDKKKRRFVGSLAPQLYDLLGFRGMAVLLLNEGAILTDALRRYVLKFFNARKRVMLTVDEYTLQLLTAGARTSKVLTKMSEHPAAVIKRILDGTPFGNRGPLDAFAGFRFLDPRIFGHETYTTYKHHFAKWETKVFHDNAKGIEREYPSIVKDEDGVPMYQNLEEFSEKLARHSFRVLRSECWDAPPKVYQPVTFQLSAEQRRVYDGLAEEFQAELSDGRVVSATHVLTRYLRLQQVASNYWPPEKVGAIHELCDGNGCPGCDDLGVVITKTKLRRIGAEDPRRDAYLDAIRANAELKTITWARFQEDVDTCMAGLRSLGRSPVQYDGRCSDEEKDAAQDAFQLGGATDLVGNPKSGGRGLKLSAAGLIVNYSNEFSLLTRLQSEDRAEDEAKKTSTGVLDLIAEDTVDEIIVSALRASKSIADYVLRERGGNWL
jgi:hypothetical protein